MLLLSKKNLSPNVLEWELGGRVLKFKYKELCDGVFKSLIFLAALVSCSRAYAELDDVEGSGVGVGLSNFSILSIESMVVSKREKRLFDAVVDALILGNTDAMSQVAQRLAAYKGLDVRSYKYDGFVSKCQKHVKIHLPTLTDASSVLGGSYHVSFHWRF